MGCALSVSPGVLALIRLLVMYEYFNKGRVRALGCYSCNELLCYKIPNAFVTYVSVSDLLLFLWLLNMAVKSGHYYFGF